MVGGNHCIDQSEMVFYILNEGDSIETNFYAKLYDTKSNKLVIWFYCTRTEKLCWKVLFKR